MESKEQNFLNLGNKKLYLHGSYLRYKNNDSENIEFLISKITSISVKRLENQYKNLLWAFTGFFFSLVSWYFLDNNLPSNILSILSFFGGAFYFISYFIFSSYLELVIATQRFDVSLEFPPQKKNSVTKFVQFIKETRNANMGIIN